MTVLAHISDLHFGRDNVEVTRQLLVYLNTLRPGLIVISGDLTQRARTREFVAARAFLRELACPYLVIPGNHDISASNVIERFGYPWRKWYRFIGRELAPAVSTEDYVVLGVNTTRRLGALFNWSRGRINDEQSRGVKEFFGAEHSERLRIVVAHHPFWLPEPYEHRRLIGGRDIAMRDFRDVGVDLILSGHVHFTYTHVLNGVIVSHAGTAVSTRLMPDSPNSFKVVRGDRRQLSIETLIWHENRFTVYQENSFTRHRGGWEMMASAG